MSLRFIMVGGFLGAGKTTTLARLARYYQSQGLRVGLVTNDQAHDLVDTNSLRAQGFSVAEVPGACFCCKFSDLIDRVGSLESSQRPEVILAEPVGSCTDLVATVVQPLKDLYQGRFSVAPYVVLFKPSHGRKILQGGSSGFSPKAAYIFTKQLEEADAIVMNRIDEFSPEELAATTKLVNDHYPGTPIIPMSAKTGAGFEVLVELLSQDGVFGRRILDINYDTYAEGEAELGWLNASVRLTGTRPFALDEFLVEVCERLRQVLRDSGGEVAHLKVIGQDDGGSFAVANLVSSDTPTQLSLASGALILEGDLTVNARVAMDPSILEKAVHELVTALSASIGISPEFRASQSLRPGRPVPTHRYEIAK